MSGLYAIGLRPSHSMRSKYSLDSQTSIDGLFGDTPRSPGRLMISYEEATSSLIRIVRRARRKSFEVNSARQQ